MSPVSFTALSFEGVREIAVGINESKRRRRPGGIEYVESLEAMIHGEARARGK